MSAMLIRIETGRHYFMLNFSHLLTGVLSIDGAADAIEFEGHWYRWGQLSNIVSQVSAALDQLGIPADGRVGVLLRNRPALLATAAAIISSDRCMVSLNPLFPDDKLRQDIEALKLPVVIGSATDFARPGLLDTLREAGAAAIQLDGVLEGAALVPGFEEPDAAKTVLTAPGVIVEMLTSGTTGVPKRVALQRKSFEKSFAGALSYESGRMKGEAPRLRQDVVSILANPITHIGGLWGALSCMVAGRKACLLERFTVSAWHDAIVRHRPKVAAAVPASLRMILDAEIPREDLSSLVALRTGTAPLDPAVTAEFWDRYGIPVLQNYGATEFSGAVAGWTLSDFRKYHEAKANSVGRFQPGVKGRVVDAETGDELPTGQEGILEMKAAQFGIGDQWLRTTDRAIIDADGFLYILGRSDNAIIRGGFKVHPDDVVSAIEKHPAIREAVVVGVPDRRLGQVPVAALMLRSGKTAPSDDELKSFLKEKLLPYQVPAEFRYVADVPRTPSMKPALTQVRDIFLENSSPDAA